MVINVMLINSQQSLRPSKPAWKNWAFQGVHQEKDCYSLLDILIWTTIKQWKLFQICISNIFHTFRF